MGIDYNRLRQTATRLMDENKQGVIEYVGVETVTPGATPLDMPTVVRVYALTSGVARGVSFKFVDGETILMTDLQVLVRYDVDTSVGDFLRIDGTDHVIVRVDNIPAAGIPLAKRLIVRK